MKPSKFVLRHFVVDYNPKKYSAIETTKRLKEIDKRYIDIKELKNKILKIFKGNFIVIEHDEDSYKDTECYDLDIKEEILKLLEK